MYKKLFITTLILLLGTQDAFAVTNVPTENLATPKIEEKSIKTIDSDLDNAETKLRSSLGPVYQRVETFRQKQATYFAGLQDSKKTEIGMEMKGSVMKEVFSFFKKPEATLIVTGEQQKPTEEKSTNSDDLQGYALLLFYTAMTWFFSSIIWFYLICILLVFLIIRFVFKMFV